MNRNIPIGDKWHNSDMMHREFKHCVFEISIGGEKEVLRGREEMGRKSSEEIIYISAYAWQN